MKGTVLYSSIMSGLCFVAAVGDHSDLRTLWIRVFFRHRDLPGNCERHCPVEETYDYLSVTPPSLSISLSVFSLFSFWFCFSFFSPLSFSHSTPLCVSVSLFSLLVPLSFSLSPSLSLPFGRKCVLMAQFKFVITFRRFTTTGTVNWWCKIPHGIPVLLLQNTV